MKRFKWLVDGEKVTCFVDEYRYYETNRDGEGVFVINVKRNDRKQLTGTCQFSVYGLTDKAKKAKLRKWLYDRYRFDFE